MTNFAGAQEIAGGGGSTLSLGKGPGKAVRVSFQGSKLIGI
jgi:hypothetical protein